MASREASWEYYYYFIFFYFIFFFSGNEINAHYYLHPYFNINAPDNKRFMAEELS